MIEIAGGVVLGVLALVFGGWLVCFILIAVCALIDGWLTDRAMKRRAREEAAKAARRAASRCPTNPYRGRLERSASYSDWRKWH